MKRLNLPIKYFVCCNGGYGSIAAMQDNHFKRRIGCDPASGLTLPDIEAVAASFGLYSVTVHKDDYEDQIRFAMSNDKPMVICIPTPMVQEQKPKLVTSMINGTLKTESFERLYPYIPADELRELMEWKP